MIEKSGKFIVAIDEESKNFTTERLGVNPKKMLVIPMGADSELFKFESKIRSKIRKDLSISKNDILFIYVGKITPHKGVHIAVNAMINILGSNLSQKMMIIGGGDEEYIRSMKNAIQESSLESHFFWIDAVPNNQLYKYYSAADISIWPLEVSIGTFEAQSCGLPLIVADNPILRDRVSFNNGLLYKPGDISDLQLKMGILASNKKLRNMFGRNGREAIIENYSWKKITEKFLDLAK